MIQPLSTVSAEVLSGNKPIRIYIHVAVMGPVTDVLQRQMNLIVRSGLYNQCASVSLLVNGDAGKLSLVTDDPENKIKVIQISDNTDSYEFPTLHYLWEESRQDDFAVLYLHTKGVSKPGNKSVKDWVNYLNYFMIEKWQDRMTELERNDCTGVNLRGSASNPVDKPEDWFQKGSPLHYSGNFWWARSAYVRLLPDPFLFKTIHEPILRYYCEMWLLQLKGVFHCAWYSGVLHHKSEPYPSFMYRKESLNHVLRLLAGKCFRIYIQLLRLIRKGSKY